MLRNEVNFKALTFLSEQTASTFNYEVKGTRAIWDPSLSIPGTNRRGGWRCPVGTRYGGQITDRFGRSCGWGVARRIANQIADIGERLENIDDRKRNNRLAKRNARMQRFLARQQKPGLLERGARNIAEALEGGQTPQQARTPARSRIPVQPPARPRIPLGGMLDENGQVMPVGGGTRPPRRRRGNLRESEARRIERELVQPGAPRTGEPPKPNAPRRRRRVAAQQGAQRVARRKPEADFVDGAQPEKPIVAPRRVDPVEARRQYIAKLDADLAKRKKEALRNRPEGISDREWKKYKEHVNGIKNEYGYGGNDRVANIPSYEEFKQFDERIQRAADEALGRKKPKPAKPSTAIPSPPPWNPDAEPAKPKAPARPAPPPLPALDIAPDREFNKPEDRPVVQAVVDDVERYKPNAYNNLRGKPKEEVLGKKIQDQELLKRAQEGFDEAYKVWREKQNGTPLEREQARDNLLRMWQQKQKIKQNIDAADLRISEIDAGIEFRQRPAVAGGNNNVQAPNAPRVQPPERPAEIPEPEGGWDVSPPTAKADHAPEKLNAKGADGFPDVKPVPVGNKGIDTKDKAVAHLNQGGDLADVPDDFLGDALHGATQRFDKEAAGGGVNGNIPDNMFKFTDKVTGKQYFLKYQTGAQAENEDIHEMVGNNIAGRFGMPVGGLRLDGKQKGGPGAPHSAGRSIVFEHAGNYVDGRLRQGRDVANMGDIKPADRVRATLMDFVIVNRDRHGGNFFVAPDANGKLRFVPIDPSLGFDVNWGGRDFEGFGGDDAGFVAWMNHSYGGGRNEMLRTLRQQHRQGQLSRREVIAAIADVQKSIRDAERKNPYLNMVDDVLKAGGDGTPNPRSGDNARERIGVKPQQKMKYITDVDPSRIADLILG